MLRLSKHAAKLDRRLANQAGSLFQFDPGSAHARGEFVTGRLMGLKRRFSAQEGRKSCHWASPRYQNVPFLALFWRWRALGVCFCALVAASEGSH